MRLQLIFPATAIGDQALTLARSWAVTDGNGWRLVLGFFLATLPVALLVLGVALFLAWAAEATGSLALAAMADLAAVGNAWLQAPLIASFLSYAYLFFRQQGTGGASANASRLAACGRVPPPTASSVAPATRSTAALTSR